MLSRPLPIHRRLLLAGAASLLLLTPAAAQETMKVGLVAAMSGQSAKSGEAIVRGLTIAIDEINAKGGVFGKKLELLVRDDESNPAKGVVAARDPHFFPDLGLAHHRPTALLLFEADEPNHVEDVTSNQVLPTLPKLGS